MMKRGRVQIRPWPEDGGGPIADRPKVTPQSRKAKQRRKLAPVNDGESEPIAARDVAASAGASPGVVEQQLRSPAGAGRANQVGAAARLSPFGEAASLRRVIPRPGLRRITKAYTATEQHALMHYHFESIADGEDAGWTWITAKMDASFGTAS